jgi:sugar-specific transcriptional regulator TrmB
MTESEELVKTLKALGLTYVQARSYIALNQIGEASVETVAKSLQTARQQLYEPLSKLETMSLVHKIIDKPPKYKALPLADALNILLVAKRKENVELQNKTSKLIKKLKEKQTTQRPPPEKIRTVILTGLEAFACEVKKVTVKGQFSFDGTATVEMFRHGMFDAGEAHREAVKRGVCYRHVISKVDEDKQVMLGDEDLRKNPLWQVRISPNPVPFHLVIVDKKEVFISTNTATKELTNYHSNCASLVIVAQSYFDILWNNSIDIKAFKS